MLVSLPLIHPLKGDGVGGCGRNALGADLLENKKAS
jgi:hypothetical protein